MRNLLWMLVVFGPLAAILVPAAHFPVMGVLAFVGFCVSVTADYPEVPPGSGDYGGWHGGGGWDGGGGGDGGGA